MTEKLQLYHCQICTNLTEVIVSGVGELVCCGKPMVLMEPQKMDEEMLHEKHVPVFTKVDDGSVEIRVGSIPHPMENEHYIQFIEAISQDKKSVQRGCSERTRLRSYGHSQAASSLYALHNRRDLSGASSRC